MSNELITGALRSRPLSRRAALLGLGAIGAGLGASGLAGCAPSTAGPAATAMRTVTHPLGSTEAPVEPQRIAVVDRRGTICHLVSLGVLPASAMTYRTIIGADLPQVLDGQVDEVTILPIDGKPDVPSLEAVAAATPDLILGWAKGITDLYPQLSAIAPTVPIEIDFVDMSVGFRAVADAVNQTAKVDPIIAGFEAKLDEAAKAAGNVGTVSVLLGVGDHTFRAYQSGSVAICDWVERFGGTLGPTPETVGGKASEFGILNLSPENLGAVDSQTIIVLYNTGETGEAALKEMESTPLWSRLPAVKAGRVIKVNSQAAVGQFGYLGFESVLADIRAQWKPLS